MQRWVAVGLLLVWAATGCSGFRAPSDPAPPVSSPPSPQADAIWSAHLAQIDAWTKSLAAGASPAKIRAEFEEASAKFDGDLDGLRLADDVRRAGFARFGPKWKVVSEKLQEALAAKEAGK